LVRRNRGKHDDGYGAVALGFIQRIVMTQGLVKRLRMALQRQIHTKLWGMDVDPTAHIEPTALIDRTYPKGIHIGPNCHIGDQAVVLSHDFSRGLYLHTTIGAGSYLGPRSIVMPGLTIGRDCHVAPGALVTKDMPDNTTAVGNPATITQREPVVGG
jgi:acetyltransferase-like isoleucine patch superfamily enzyme